MSSRPAEGMVNVVHVEARLRELGLLLPEPIKLPQVQIQFARVRTSGNHAYVSGHGAQNPDGSVAGPFGMVGAAVSVEQANQSARLATLSILADLKRELGDLDRVTAWLAVRGYVNAVPGFAQTTTVLNGFSDLILELYGAERGTHARSAIGVTALPLNLPVVIEAEVEIA